MPAALRQMLLGTVVLAPFVLGLSARVSQADNSGRDQHWTLKTLLPARKPAFGMRKILVVAERRLADHAEVRQRLERYAEDIWRAYGAGVKLISLESDSPRYLKGLMRREMPLGLAGVVLVGKVPKAYGEVFDANVWRDIFLCDMYFMNQNTRALHGGNWEDPGWIDEGRPWRGIVKTESVRNIDFNWGLSSPDPSAVPVDRFSARYRGTLKPPRSGTYTFTISSDNGRRLSVKGIRVIDAWVDDWGKDYSGTITLEAGVSAPIVLDYFEDFGAAEVHLKWTPPGSKTASVVPASAFSDLTADYYNSINLGVDREPKGTRPFAHNGAFDCITDGRGGAQVDLMAPHVFVSRIETHTSSFFGDEVQLLTEFFDKDHVYWSGSMPLGKKAVLSFGGGSVAPDPVVVDRVAELFAANDIQVRVNPRNGEQYLKDLANPANLVSVYCGHGWEEGIGLGLGFWQLKHVPVQPLFVDLETCSPLRSIRVSAEHPDGYDLPGYIGGAHLFADRGKGHCLFVRGASKTSGGNQHEEFLYRALADGKPAGIAFVEWARQRMALEGGPGEWFGWFYPQVMIGDPLIVMGPAPRRAGSRPHLASNAAKAAGSPKLLAYYPFEDDRDGTTADVMGGPRAAFRGDAHLAASGKYGRAAEFRRAGDWIDTGCSILDITKSWSVAAWVWLSDGFAADFRTALSQDSDRHSGFYLQYCRPGGGAAPDSLCLAKWKTTAGEAALGVHGNGRPEANRWIHLAAIQDVERKTCRLYIDGELADEQTYDAAGGAFEWAAPGNTVIGRGQYDGRCVNPFLGRIDEVYLFQGVLSAKDVCRVRDGKFLAQKIKRRTAAPLPHTFVNPVVQSGADPWVIRRGDAYYFCQSHHGAVWVGTTDRLERLGQCDWKQVWTPPPASRYSRELWAPELHFLRGRWYIYVAADGGRNEDHRMIVLEGSHDDPQAPFAFQGVLSAATDRWAIDGTVLEMPNGRLYFIWSGWEGTQNVAQNLYIARMSDPTTIQGDRVCISRPEYAWEKHGRPLINEGPEVLRHGKKIFIIYSASGSWGDDYCLGQLSLIGHDPMKPGAWVKKPSPVFSRSDTVFGPGHASFTTSLDGREDWIVYHAAKAKGSGWNRDVRIQPFRWNRDGSPNFGQPVSPGVEIPAPKGDSTSKEE